MADVLAEIVAHTRRQVEQAKLAVPVEQLTSDPGYFLPRRNCFGAVAAPRLGGPNLIVELGEAGAPAAPPRPAPDAVGMARQAEAAGACAVSLNVAASALGDRVARVREVKAAVGLPVLRGDGLLDVYQLHESRAAGADAVAFIADALEPPETVALVETARRLELTVLLVLHERRRARATLAAVADRVSGGVLAGLSNRDPRTLAVDPAVTETLAPAVPPGMPIVAMHGLRTRADIQRMHAAGARAVLVGDVLAGVAELGSAVRALFGRPR